MRTEEYLWDKTGGDAEIERLESALAAFRYKASDPPALPVEVVPVRADRVWRIPRFAFAMAASFAVLLVSVGLLMRPSTSTTDIQPELAESVQPKTDVVFPKPPTPAKNTATPKKQTTRRTLTTFKRGTPTIRNNTTARIVETRTPAVKLSKEELYAYNQLMLALEITGSKLRLVRDKVETDQNSRGK